MSQCKWNFPDLSLLDDMVNCRKNIFTWHGNTNQW